MSVELNMIYNENCVDTMQRMESGSIDLVVTSPPYDDLRTYNGYSFDFEQVAKELTRIIKPGGVIVWVVNDATQKGSETGTSFKQALFFKELGLNLHDTMIWHKPNVFNFGSNNCYKQAFEYMFILSKGRPASINLIKDVPAKSAGTIARGARKHANGERDVVPDFIVADYKKRDNVWQVNVNGATNGHPAVFPEQIAADHISTWSNKNETVYDPFMGSGTTAKMALKLGRNFIGSEISAEYIEIANKRIEN